MNAAELKFEDGNEYAEYYTMGKYVVIINLPLSSGSFNWEVRQGEHKKYTMYVASGNAPLKSEAKAESVKAIQDL